MRCKDCSHVRGYPYKRSLVALRRTKITASDPCSARWPNSGRGIDLIDMNREWPGNENGTTAAGRHAWLLFNRLLRPNADVAIDFHTGTTGFDVTAFNLGSMDVPEIKTMLELYPVGQIFNNHVYPGVLHNAFVDVGIPAFAPEIGAARVAPQEATEHEGPARGAAGDIWQAPTPQIHLNLNVDGKTLA